MNPTEAQKRLVCVSEQQCSIFFTRLWSVRKAPISDTQNTEISRFSTANTYK